MKFYSIQKLKAWEKAIEKGVLATNKDYIDLDWFGESYSWMMKQIEKRLKNYNNEYPIWLWLTLDNINFNELLDDDYVLLEIELNEDEVLLSNFEAWHTVLNNGCFDDSLDISKEESWEYIFDKYKLNKYGYSFANEDLQGVTGNIDIENIKVLKYIVNNI